MNKVLFTLCDETFTLRDCICAFCACVLFIALFLIASTIDYNYQF